jgi:diaminopimelate epimerase
LIGVKTPTKKRSRRTVKIKIFKYQGAGNDFVVIDKITTDMAEINLQVLSKKICDRHYGVGADGLVVLKKENDQLAWEFFNSDGSYASMCGNAARCVALHMYKQHHIEKGDITTGAGQVSFQKEGSEFLVEMPPYSSFQKLDEDVHFVNTGVPHVVIKIHRDEDVFSYIKMYRWHKVAGQHGANVSFYYQERDAYLAKTFERGVEGFTLACGTGAAACGLVIYKLSQQQPIKIKMPGGDLSVRIIEDKIYLLGEAKLIFQGDYHV